MSASAKVCIVDDDENVRASLRALLESAGFSVLDFSSGKSLLSQFVEAGCDCVIADMRMPQMDGLELQQQLRKVAQGLSIIFITAYGDVHSAVQALRSGAVDFIEKPFDDETIINTVHAALRRVQPNYIEPMPEAAAADKAGSARPAASEEAKARIAALSPREQQVFRLLVTGLSNKAIARELSLSPRTVEIHRGNIMRRLGVHNLAQLVRLGLAGGINGMTH